MFGLILEIGLPIRTLDLLSGLEIDSGIGDCGTDGGYDYRTAMDLFAFAEVSQ
jgi:hypothetical protein